MLASAICTRYCRLPTCLGMSSWNTSGKQAVPAASLVAAASTTTTYIQSAAEIV